MQKLFIVGNLTKDPELRHTQEGIAVCGFTVAVNRKKSATNQNPGADFFNVNAWRALGENCAKYLNKGRKVAVTGKISLRTWEKDGKHGASLEVMADDIEFLSPWSDAAEPAPSAQSAGFIEVETDDLPY